jgi:two-component system sensor histidine kinase YesM
MRNRIMLTFAMITLLVVLALQLVSYANAAKVVQKNAVAYSELLVRNLSGRIDDIYQELDSLTQTLLINEEFLTALMHVDSASPEAAASLRNRIQREIESILSTRTDIDRILIVSNGGNVFLGGPNNFAAPSDTQLASILSEDELTLLLPPHQNETAIYRSISVLRKLRSFESPEVLGSVQIDLRTRTLDEIMRTTDLAPNSVLLYAHDEVVYSAGSLLSAADGGQMGERLTSPFGTARVGSHMISFIQSDYTGLYTVFVVPRTVLLRDLNTITIFSVVVAIIGCGVAILLINLNARVMTRSVERLMTEMKQMEADGWNTPIPPMPKDEIGVISEGINHMVVRLKILLEQNAQIQIKSRETELLTLQSQINPHFLYNTLDAVRMNILLGSGEESATMLEELSALLRRITATQSETIPLQEELEFIESYVHLHNLRFRQKFTLMIDIPTQWMDMPIPKFILQTVVENAIKHGLERKKDDRRIEILSECRADRLVLIVRDNGVGIPTEKLERLRVGIEETSSGYTNNIGLHNVNSRLRLHYDLDCGLTIDSKEGVGTAVYLHFGLPNQS